MAAAATYDFTVTSAAVGSVLGDITVPNVINGSGSSLAVSSGGPNSPLPAKRRAAIETRAGNLATLRDLRQAAEQTQQDLAATLGVGQDTISRLEKRSDMLLSTMRRYVEAMGGTFQLVAQFPNRPPVVIDHLAPTVDRRHGRGSNAAA